jgi:hypothetical protein
MKSYKQQYLDQHKLKEPIKSYQHYNPQGVTKFVIYLVNLIRKLEPQLSENFNFAKEVQETTIDQQYLEVEEQLLKIEADIQYFEDLEDINLEKKSNGQITRFFNKIQRNNDKKKRREEKRLIRNILRTTRIRQRSLTPYSRRAIPEES